MVRPKFCGLAQAMNEMRLNVPRIKNPLESEAFFLLIFFLSSLFAILLSTSQIGDVILYRFLHKSFHIHGLVSQTSNIQEANTFLFDFWLCFHLCGESKN